MSVYFVRHGKCTSKEINHNRPLTEEGRDEVTKTAYFLKNSRVIVSAIVHSGKERAKETANIFAEKLEAINEVSSIEGLAPLDSVSEFAQQLDPKSNIMYVGHLPFMERIISHLLGKNEDITVIKFQNSGIVCMDTDNKNWYVKWAVFPELF
ncbi:phosphohistidine phosphatase SixA [Candidatus Margulisiibacteriota bacterium]